MSRLPLHQERSPGPTTLRIAQTIADTEAEGPGRRFALWTQGCAILCSGCCNPEMLAFEGGTHVSVDDLAKEILATKGIEGVSYLGGEPTSQARPLAMLSRIVKQAGLSVMLFSGHTLAELREAKRPEVDDLLASCDLLVDGKYERDLPETERRWIGSSNQVMHFLTDRYDPTDARFRTKNTAEIRIVKGQIVVNGWPALAQKLIPLKRASR